MKNAQLFLFAILLAAGATAARADEPTAAPSEAAGTVQPKAKAKSKGKAKKKKMAVEAPPVQEVSVPMARGQLEAEVAADVAQRERANAPRTKVEIGASSWKPNRVTTSSRVANATDFQTKGIPSTDVSFFTPVLGRQLHLQFGAGFLAMQRTGTISSTGINVPVDQNGYVMSLRLGVAYSPWMLLGDKLVPYASAALLPSLFMTRSSAFDDGVSDTGLPLEVGAGATYQLSKIVGLDLGVSEVLGKVQDSDFKGFGFRAGVRFAI